MAATKIYDLAAVVGQYQQNGETKNRYQRVGAVMQKEDGGKFIMLERWFNPAGVPNPENRSNLLLSMFDPDQAEGGGRRQQQRPQAPAQRQAPAGGQGRGFDGGDDDIPF